jgi:class 3 adenylate cyclase
VRASLDIVQSVSRLTVSGDMKLQVRIGITTGPVIAGVVGKHKFTYDIWGNTVNVAERLEAASEPGRVNIAESTWNHVRSRFETQARGSIEVKGKGPYAMYFLDRIKPEYSADPGGLTPNPQFWQIDAEGGAASD